MMSQHRLNASYFSLSLVSNDNENRQVQGWNSDAERGSNLIRFHSDES